MATEQVSKTILDQFQIIPNSYTARFSNRKIPAPQTKNFIIMNEKRKLIRLFSA